MVTLMAVIIEHTRTFHHFGVKTVARRGILLLGEVMALPKRMTVR